MKNIIIPTLVLSTLLASCSEAVLEKKMPSPGDAVPVKIIALDKAGYESPVHASGQFTTDDETILSFKTGGVIQKIYVKEGQRVKKGQVLATLDVTEIAAQVNQAQLGFEKAQRDFKRAENLYRDSVATLEQFQNARTGVDIAQQQLTAARFNLGYSEIRAVSDGVVLQKMANSGQVVGPGTPVLQTGSAGSNEWMLRVGVSDHEWARIQLNDSAVIHTGADDEIIHAHVSSKAESADPYTGLFSIELKLPAGKTRKLASGMFGKATIHTTKRQQAWQVPYDALLDGNGNEGFVFVTNDKKTAYKVPVKISSIEKDRVLVSQGLENRTYLVVSGSAYLADRSKITITR